MNTLPTAADLVLANAVSAQANTAATAKPKNQHWVNIYYAGGTGKIGAFPIDSETALVAACQSDVNFAQAYFGSKGNPFVEYVYQQAGVSNKPKPAIDAAAIMAAFNA